MFVTLRSPVFIDALHLELAAGSGVFLKGILRDDQGSVCSTLERKVSQDLQRLIWSGLNDLPYGRYTLELSRGEDAQTVNLVKRV